MNVTNSTNTLTDATTTTNAINSNATISTTTMNINNATNPINININITLNGNGSFPMSTMTSKLTTTTMTPLSPLTTVPTTTLAAAITTTTAATTTLGTTKTTATISWLGLPMSSTLLIIVFTGCTALTLCVLCIICCRLLCLRDRRDSSAGDRIKRQTSRQQSSNHYADPRVTENHYHSNDVTKFYATPELTYARPEIYSTFINPSFYEDVYARWRLQEQARYERSYESPNQYSRQLKDQMDTPGFKWSASSLRVLDSYDYDKYGRIPRGKLSSVDTDKEDTETATMATAPEFTTF